VPRIARGIVRLAAALAMLGSTASGCRSAAEPAFEDHGFVVHHRDDEPPAVPWLAVVIVDRLGARIASQRWPLLPFEGGIARLAREGLVVREMRYAHAVAQAAPGHAALFTGATPRVTGIFGDEMIAAPGADPVSILADPATRPVVLPGTVPEARGAASSLGALRVETLADVLMEQHPADAWALSVSLTDQAALLAGGRHPELVAWWSPKWASFVTSSAFPPRSSDLAQAASSGYAAAVRTSGDANRAVLAAGKSLGVAASQVSHRVLIVLSFSSSEAGDDVRRIDQDLADLLAALDRARGPSGYAVMLTADRGSPSRPEPPPRAMAAALERAVGTELGSGPWVAGIAAPWVFLTERGKNLPAGDRARLVAIADRTLRAQFGVTRVQDVRAEPSECPGLEDESIEALVCRTTVPDGNADLLLVPPSDDDRAVPLIVRAPWTVPRSSHIDGPLPYTAFTHTAAALLGIRPPAGAEPGPDLTWARARQLAGVH
jgi:hypothetical protein